MTGAIRLLRPDVASKIAAGEVIERPASATKELLENALDAGATRISIEVRGGGVELIRVSDNGSGIPSDQVELAFERFATSKVTRAEDLDAITTLGFRGEALPSIASVSRVTLSTRAQDEESGTRIDVSDGSVVRLEATGAPTGTTIGVSGLFRNFPARQKFLRSAGAETSRIQTVVTRYALAYPEVAFELDLDRGKRFASPGSGSLREAVAAVYGLKTAQAMLEMSPEEADDDSQSTARGLTGDPSMSRANRSYVSFFVNRRWIQNRALGVAVDQAYHGFMAERRFPLAVINIDVPPGEVDVNAHPSKTEVRFRQEGQIFATVQQAVRRALIAHAPVPEVRGVRQGQAHTQPSSSSTASGSFWPAPPFLRQERPSAGMASPPIGWPDAPTGRQNESPVPDIPQEPVVPRNTLPVLRVLGQVQSTYIVAEGPDGMYLIDQHAAHERVIFEQVKAEAMSGEPDVQTLLEPIVVEVNPELHNLVRTQAKAVASLGFLVEPFGGDAYLVRGVPVLLGASDPAQAFVDILELMADGGGFETWEERAAYSIACHSAIRAGKTLVPEEMTGLVRRLEACVQPNTCPHGRPTMIHMTTGQLEREFGRR